MSQKRKSASKCNETVLDTGLAKFILEDDNDEEEDDGELLY